MPFEFRALMFGIVTVLVAFLILADISEVEEEIANTGIYQKFHSQNFIPKSNSILSMPGTETSFLSEEKVKTLQRIQTIQSGIRPVPKNNRNMPLKTSPSLDLSSKDLGSKAIKNCSSSHASKNKSVVSDWSFNRTLSSLIRKNILRFLDAERDISILKGTLKPGDVVHYIFDRQSTMNISENLYRLLPTASPMKNQHHRLCAIVGNSGILLNSSCGPEIDSHDFVIRCNLAPVEEYAADVGHRTDLVTMNPSVVQRAFQDLANEEWRERFVQRLRALSGSVLWIPAFMAKGGEERVEWAIRLILLHTVNVRTAFPSLRLLHAVRGYWLTNQVLIKRPTTGLLMYTMATRFCEEIHLYGFWPFHRDAQGKPVKYHYYDALTYEYTSHSSPHTMPLEFRTLRALHRQGALRLHTGTCSPAA